MQKDRWSRRVDWIKTEGPSGITYVQQDSVELYNENRIIAVGDIYFRLNKYLTGVTFTYVNNLEDIYKKDIMTGDGYSIVCMYNEYDVIDREMKNIIFVDVASNVNINLNYIGKDNKTYPQQWREIDGVKLKPGHLVLLKNQNDITENDIYKVTNKYFLENANYLSTREKSNKFSCSVKLGSNFDKQFFLSGSTELELTNNGFGFPIYFEPKTFIEGESYIIKHLINYNLYNTLRSNQQIIDLNSGFNIVSFNMTPINPDIKAIFQPFIDYGILWKVVDEHGNSLDEFDGFINHIGDVNPEEGYYVYTYRSATLTVTGSQIILPILLNLSSGLNVISYPAQKSQDALNVVKPLIDEGKLITVVDEVGNSIIFSGGTWNNYIGNFIPGHGYEVEVSSDCLLQISESEESISSSKIIFTDYELARKQVDDNYELYSSFYVKITGSTTPSKYLTIHYHRDKPYIIRHDTESNSIATGTISNIKNTDFGTVISGLTANFNVNNDDYLKINLYSGSSVCLTMNTFVKDNLDYLSIEDIIPNDILSDLKDESFEIYNLNIANSWSDFISNKVINTPYSNFYSLSARTFDSSPGEITIEFKPKEYAYDKYFDYDGLEFYFSNDSIYRSFDTLNQFVKYDLYERLNDIDPISFNSGFTFFNNYLLSGFTYQYTKSHRIKIITSLSGVTNIFKPYTYVYASALGQFTQKTMVYEVTDNEIIIEKPKDWTLYKWDRQLPQVTSIQNIDGLKNISDILYELYMNQPYDGGWYIKKSDNERKNITKSYAKMLTLNETFRNKVTGILYENKDNEFILNLYDLERDSNLYFSPIELIFVGADRKSRLPVPLTMIGNTTTTTTKKPITTTNAPATTTTTTTIAATTTTTTIAATTTTTTIAATTTTTTGAATTTTTTGAATTTTTTTAATTTTTTASATTTTTTIFEDSIIYYGISSQNTVDENYILSNFASLNQYVGSIDGRYYKFPTGYSYKYWCIPDVSGVENGYKVINNIISDNTNIVLAYNAYYNVYQNDPSPTNRVITYHSPIVINGIPYRIYRTKAISSTQVEYFVFSF